MGKRYYNNKYCKICHSCYHWTTDCPRRRGNGKSAKRRKMALGAGMTVVELKAECKKRGLRVSGKKAELIARLNEDLVKGAGVARAPAAAVAPAVAIERATVDALSRAFPLTGGSGASLPSLSQTSRGSVTSSSTEPSSASASKPSGLTREQKERMERNREEARKRKMAAAAAAAAPYCASASKPPYPSGEETRTSQLERLFPTLDQKTPTSALIPHGGSNANRVVTQSPRRMLQKGGLGANHVDNSPGRARGTKGAKNAVVVNPYLRKASVTRREGGVPEKNPNDLTKPGDVRAAPIRTPDDLPPLPPDAPPVREETLRRLSDQQLDVIMAARPPPPSPSKEEVEDASRVSKNLFPSKEEPVAEPKYPDMVRVNAAAGTGKTTTLIHLATRCIDLGHKSLTYVTFSRASARDAVDRMVNTLDDEHKTYVTAQTLHSCACRLLNTEELDDDSREQDKRPLNDVQLKNMIRDNWRKEIDDHLREAKENVRSTTREGDRGKIAAREGLLEAKVLHLLYKTFENFCRKKMTLNEHDFHAGVINTQHGDREIRWTEVTRQ